MTARELPVKAFATPKAFRAWLEKNHQKSDGIWVRFFKKASKKKSVSYKEALDEALCYGWIDSTANPFDEESYIQRFTPRRARSVWSKRNRDHVERLIKEQRMTAAGLKEIARAKADGRWDGAYDSPKDMKVPDDFLALLAKNRKASATFKTLNKANLYAIGYRLQSAKKPETRERRMHAILAMLEEGKTFH